MITADRKTPVLPGDLVWRWDVDDSSRLIGVALAIHLHDDRPSTCTVLWTDPHGRPTVKGEMTWTLSALSR